MSTDSVATDSPHTTSRTPIVLVHGLRVSGQTFRRVAGSLADRDVVCPDMPGHGSRADETFTLDGAVAAVVDAIDSVGGSAVVVGMSMGGYVAMATAARHPDRVAGLGVLCATAQPSGLLAAPFRLFGAATSVLPSEAAQVSRVLTRIAVGREGMSRELQALAFLAGANSIFIGGKLLTTPLPGQDKDSALLAALGLRAAGAERIVVVRAITAADDPQAAARTLKSALEDAARARSTQARIASRGWSQGRLLARRPDSPAARTQRGSGDHAAASR